MKTLIHHFTRTILCLTVSAAIAACSNEDDSLPKDKDTASLALSIPQLQASSRAVGTDAENAIHTLRVIITNENGAYINRDFTLTDVTNGTVTIDHVPVGTVQMYVIANEAALGKDYSNYDTWKGDIVEVLGHSHKKVLVKDESRMHFPLRLPDFEAGGKGLPMSWENLSLTVYPPVAGDNAPQEVEVNLVRCVAKLNIIMNNALTDEINIDQMSFGRFFADRIYLFKEGSLDIPSDAVYNEDVLSYTGLDIAIPGGESKTLGLYIYPSFAWKEGGYSPYTIGFHTKAGNDYPMQAFVNDYGTLHFITRNKQINIHATLSSPANVDISFKVVPWEEKQVEVPPFN